jgi:hypothetical protein
VASAVLQGPDLLAQVLFTPLLAAWSIWVGIAISTRSSDTRVALQLGALAGLPAILVAYLIAFNVIHTRSAWSSSSRRRCSFSTDSAGGSYPRRSTANG